MTETRKQAARADKPAKARSSARKPRAKRRSPEHAMIAERAYFIHLQSGESDEVANWLQAERELAVA